MLDKLSVLEVDDTGKILVNERLVVRLQLLNVGYDGALGVEVVLAASITVVDYLHGYPRPYLNSLTHSRISVSVSASRCW